MTNGVRWSPSSLLARSAPMNFMTDFSKVGMLSRALDRFVPTRSKNYSSQSKRIAQTQRLEDRAIQLKPTNTNCAATPNSRCVASMPKFRKGN